jgi:hypothetical protein
MAANRMGTEHDQRRDDAAESRDGQRDFAESSWGVGSASALESLKQREAQRSRGVPKHANDDRPSAE